MKHVYKSSGILPVATVLTACGIETHDFYANTHFILKLQQYLPLAVLKPKMGNHEFMVVSCNSTYRLRYWNLFNRIYVRYCMIRCNSTYRLRYWNMPFSAIPTEKAFAKLQQYLPLAVLKLFLTSDTFTTNFWVATVLTACGIETEVKENKRKASVLVATVLTACGIETLHVLHETFLKCWKLQQYLPLAVLKQAVTTSIIIHKISKLQQYLPLAVLKPRDFCWSKSRTHCVATVLTACGIETNNISKK